MIQIHIYTLIAMFLFFVAGMVIPAHLKFKSLTKEKMSGHYLMFHQASKNRQRLILVLMISGTLLLSKYPFVYEVGFIKEQVRETFIFMTDVSIVFLTMLLGGRIGNFLLKYFEDKK